MSRTIVVFIIFLGAILSLIALAYFGVISKNNAGCAIMPLVLGYTLHKLGGEKDRQVSMWKMMEGKVDDSQLL